MTMLEGLLVVHALSTTYMAGLVWFVQIVHYPLLPRIPAEAFPAYERAHTRRTAPITGGPMLIEAGSAIALAVLAWHRPDPAWHIAGLSLLAIIWLSTFFVQVPMHARLERGKDDRTIARLVATNWVRTIAWSARAVLAVLLVAREVA